LSRHAAKHSPSPVQEILGDAAGQLNLVADLDPGPLEVFSTDFTELSYSGGNRKAYLMAVVDLESKYVPGWAVGPSANRKLAMRCWEQVRKRMASLGEGLGEKIIHHDLDSVYTSYRWLRAILLDDEMRISYSESGARGNPWIESLWGRTKAEVGSRITEASSLPALRTVFDERFRYYNQDRRHSSIGQIPPREHLGQTLDTLESEPQIAAAS
jgi:transposase InsO family protein